MDLQHTAHSHKFHENCAYSWVTDISTTTQIANVIGKYVSPSITVVGLAGNLLSLCVMLQPRNRATSFGVYLAVLAICDSGGLITWLYRTYVMAYSRRGLDDVGCMLDIGFKYSFRMIGYLLIVCLTTDRYVAVRHPMRALQWCRARRAVFISICITSVSFLLAVPAFLMFRQNHHRLYACVLYEDSSALAAGYMIVISALGNIIPFFVILAMNASIIWTIRRRLKYRGVCDRHLSLGYMRRPVSDSNEDSICSQSSESSKPLSTRKVSFTVSHKDGSGNTVRSRTKSFSCADCAQTMLPLSRRDRNLINILLLITAAFLILNSPQLVRVAVSYFYHMDHTCSQRGYQYLMFQITNNMCNVNYSVNFFLYCFSGTKFRKDLVKMLNSWSSRAKRFYRDSSMCST